MIGIYIFFKWTKKTELLQIAIEEVQTRDIIESVFATGKIYAENEYKIYPEASGEITSLTIQEGNKVTKGQLLAIIKTNNTNPISISDILSQNVTPKTQTPKITYKNIYAPISGTINILNIKKGENTFVGSQMMNSEMMRIADMTKMKVVVSVSENEIQKIKTHDTAIIEVTAYPKIKFKGLVNRISQTNENTNGMSSAIQNLNDQVTNYYVSITFINESYQELIQQTHNDTPFRIGMTASVEIQTNKHEKVLSVPYAAITTRTTADSTNQNETIPEYVFVYSQQFKQVELTPVQTGLSDNQHIEITQGLHANQQIVIAPFTAIAKTLTDKMKVKVVSKKELYQKENN